MLKANTNSLIATTIVFLILISSGSIASVLYSKFVYIAFLLIICFLAIFGYDQYKFSAFRINNMIAAFLVFVIITLPSQLFNGLSVEYAVLLVRFFFICLLFSLFPARFRFDNYIFNALKMITYLSIFSFLVANVTDSGFVYYERGDFTVESIGFIINRASTVNFWGIQFYRNQGIFWEPGLLQLFISVFLIQAIQRKDNIGVVASIIALLMTFSATGFIVCSLIFVLKFKLFDLGATKKALISVLVLIFTVYLVYMKVNVSGQVSYMARYIDFVAGMRMLNDNLMLGVGYGMERYISIMHSYVSELIFNYESRGSTNSVLFLFTSFGVPAALVYMFTLYKQNVFVEDRGLYYIVFLISAISSPFLFMNFYLVLWLSAFQKRI